jgi:ECF sigma factor
MMSYGSWQRPKLAQEKPGQTFQATALMHDAYIRLVNVEKLQHWDSRGHFFGAGSELYRDPGALVVGGLICSTIFSLVVVPLLFSLVLDCQAALRRVFSGQRSTAVSDESLGPPEVGDDGNGALEVDSFQDSEEDSAKTSPVG